jgi:hypothetical protein
VTLLPLVEGGDVGEADDGLPHLGLAHRGLRRSLALQPLQEAQGSVAASGAEDGPYGRICESVNQLSEAALIVARQVPVAAENSGVVLNAVAIGNDGEPRVE